MYYVYVLVRIDQDYKIYIGYTKNLKHRLISHNSKSNRGWTRGRRWKLVYYEAYLSDVDARKREDQLKHDGRAKRWVVYRIAESLKWAKISAGQGSEPKPR
jgi:putative endonuclease